MPLLKSIAFFLLIPLFAFAQPSPAAGGGIAVPALYKSSVTPHWFDNNTRFWYRNALPNNASEFILVIPDSATRQPAFDHTALAQSLSKAAVSEVKPDHLPFELIEFVNNNAAIRFTAFNRNWDYTLQTKECVPASAAPASLPSTTRPGRGGAPNFVPGRGGFGGRSPNSQFTAFLRENNLFLRDPQGAETPLSTDGAAQNTYTNLQWSPDSQTIVAFRKQPGDTKEVFRIQSSPPNAGRALLQRETYPLPGDKLDTFELNIFTIADKKQIKPNIELIDMDPMGTSPNPRVRFLADGKHFTLEKFDRGHQRVRLIEVNSLTGESRNIIDEQSQTFIWSAHTEDLPNYRVFTYLSNENQFLHMSEESGYRHIYHYAVQPEKIEKIVVTKGNWVVKGITRVDEQSQQIYFTACGVFADQDPYFVHHGRVNFDGKNLIWLTEANGNHSATWSPDNKYLIDTYSRVDQPPTIELRKVADGKKVCDLEKAELTNLQSFNTTEVFVAKGRDGQTDIWGIICRPRNFDPTQKYPVIEYIYAGPQGNFVPKNFSLTPYFEFLTRMGFIVVQCDGMGTANRSKAFHDVCWKNIKDGGFPDRIAWIKSAAAKYPYMDLSKVGIYGTSAGGQNAAAAVLFHPDFYKAAVANCGCHDNRMDKVSWNEQWMGYPVGPQYSASSNIDNAAKLQGSLMLIAGELDNNVPPESTYRFADALIKAKKDFDFVLIPNAGHGASNTPGANDFVQHKEQDFFLRTLKNELPQNRNQ